MKKPAQKILVCDDEPQILRALRVLLRTEQYEVIATATMEEALDQSALHPVDAAIVDLVLPDGSGTDLCKQLRSWSEMPILILSAIDEEDEKVAALEAGADDYVTKPFNSRELLARLRAALRRVKPVEEEPTITIGTLRIDRVATRVSVDQTEIHLTPIEYRLLLCLAENRGRLITHRKLLAEVWGAEYVDDIATLRTHMSNLRRKLSSNESLSPIRTESGSGYRLFG